MRQDGADTLVTIVRGGESAFTVGATDVAWPRDWNAAFVANTLFPSGERQNSRTIRLAGAPLAGAGEITVQWIEITGDEFADLVIAVDSTTDKQSPVTQTFDTGYVYSGEVISQFVSTAAKSDLILGDRLAKIRSEVGLSQLRTVVTEDANGDGIQDLLFGSPSIGVATDIVTPAIIIGTDDVRLFPGLSTKLKVTVGSVSEVLTITHVDGPDAGTDLSASDLVEQVNQKILGSALAHLVEASLVNGSIKFATDDGGSDVGLVVQESIDSHPLGFSLKQQQSAPKNYVAVNSQNVLFEGQTITLPGSLTHVDTEIIALDGERAPKLFPSPIDGEPGLTSRVRITFDEHVAEDILVDGDLRYRKGTFFRGVQHREATITVEHQDDVTATITEINQYLRTLGKGSQFIGYQASGRGVHQRRDTRCHVGLFVCSQRRRNTAAHK
ncbi:MAG: hypothetical protein HYV60_12170 [Planctomycetia bacterium]|nr:hypothetical protein [Planctomycetia bacterium]